METRQGSSAHHVRGRQDFDFSLDKPEAMTYSRRIAIALMKYPWYYPRKRSPNRQEESDEHFSNETMSVLSFSMHKSTTFRKASLAKEWSHGHTWSTSLCLAISAMRRRMTTTIIVVV
jgi:hypothetical protein